MGKAPSGSICFSTRMGAGYPARSTMRERVYQPTPCIAVYTQRRPEAPEGAGATAAVAST